MAFNYPLAYRMRPQTVADIVGQDHLLDKHAILSQMLAAERLQSLLLYGPPGCGKTSLAHALAGTIKRPLRHLNAATDTKKDLQALIAETKISDQVVLLVDEIHRLDRIKQDYLLPHLESGRIILIGATTENPFMSVTPAIRSRTHLLQLEPITTAAIVKRLQTALDDQDNGLGKTGVSVTTEQIKRIAATAHGDLRTALNNLEIAVQARLNQDNQKTQLSDADLTFLTEQQPFASDKNGDHHYDTLSALQKAIRGSDTDAALHYSARLILAGNLTSLIRRLLVIAYEDIGLANPTTVQQAVTAIQTAEKIGLPEARIPIANAVILLALARKSNSAYQAMDAAIAILKTKGTNAIPVHLRDGHYQGAQDLGHGNNYQYPHDFPNHWVAQQYLPDVRRDDCYFHPNNPMGDEATFLAIYDRLKKQQRSD